MVVICHLLKKRSFNWNKYNQFIAEGETPSYAAYAARPKVALDWDNIVLGENGYAPKVIKNPETAPEGFISRGDQGWYLTDRKGNAMFNGDEDLNQIMTLVKENGPRMYANELRYAAESYPGSFDERVLEPIKDIKNPTWQEIVRSIMKLRYLDE